MLTSSRMKSRIKCVNYFGVITKILLQRVYFSVKQLPTEYLRQT